MKFEGTTQNMKLAITLTAVNTKKATESMRSINFQHV